MCLKLLHIRDKTKSNIPQLHGSPSIKISELTFEVSMKIGAPK